MKLDLLKDFASKGFIFNSNGHVDVLMAVYNLFSRCKFSFCLANLKTDAVLHIRLRSITLTDI